VFICALLIIPLLKALRKDNGSLKEQLEILLKDFTKLEQSVNGQESTKVKHQWQQTNF
jgi:hypothetical protein